MDEVDGDNGGACGPRNLWKKVACRMVLGRWWSDGWYRTVLRIGQGGKDDLLQVCLELGDGRRRIGGRVRCLDGCSSVEVRMRKQKRWRMDGKVVGLR
jgi:hypothetical protein